jgi:D-alanine-D-alanine ligase
VLVEEFVTGTELTASILGPRAAADPHRGAAGQLRLPQQVFLRRDEVLLPGGFRGEGGRDPRRVAARLRRRRLHGWGRLDLILRADGTYSFLEVNTSPA